MRLGLLIAVRAGTAIVVSAAAVQFWGLAIRGETPRLTPSLALPPTATAVAAIEVNGRKHRRKTSEPESPSPPSSRAVVPIAPLGAPPPAQARKPPTEVSPNAARGRPASPGTRPKTGPPAPPAAQPEVAVPPIAPEIAPAPPAPPTTEETEPDPHSHVAIAPPDPQGTTSMSAPGDQSRHEGGTHGKKNRT